MKWTPITEGMPPTGVPLIVTVIDKVDNSPRLRYPVHYTQNAFSKRWQWCLHESYLSPKIEPVVAWMTVPEPYREEAND